MRRASKVWLAAASATIAMLATQGCEEDLPKVTLIEHMRVLGAKQEVVGDETRAVPKPGETARMTWEVAYPKLTQTDDELASFFIECTAPSRYTGTPVCQEFIDAAQGRSTGLGFGFSQPPMGCDVKPDSTQTVAGIRLVCVTGTPAIDVKVGKSVKSARLVQGIICRNGVPRIDLDSPTGATCDRKPNVDSDDFEAITVYGTVNVATEPDQENHNPDISKATFRIGEATSEKKLWLPTDPELLPGYIEDCSTAPMGTLATSEGFQKVITIDYPRQTTEKTEDIVFSIYATFGELSRRFTVFESTGEQVDAPALKWELSEEERDALVAKPKLVRFYFTVVDGRGGFDITTRYACINRLK
jgi:hypothetical protein